ncbi:phasin family protein [Janthinobacterium sp. TND4EL3]|uniref:TIGR01841 family phasin n=1 Tax=Janthinobacterium sp. TND4EL3 TaxID=1907311 RepID=UPI0009544D8B|nr:TIGR01841 family phasin [Janthinobacterium sp. TND4EL3]SIP95639.1 phasin family protein [Janthinobacterium sp. TND4EL3]
MFSFSEQWALAGKALVEAQLISAQAYAKAAYASGASVVDLQLDAARTALAAATVAGNELLSAKDPQALLQLSRAQSQLAIERIDAYGRQAKDVAQETQEKFASVTKGEFAASRQKFDGLLQVVKQTPVPLIIPFNNFLKTTFGGADEGYDKNKNTRPARRV